MLETYFKVRRFPTKVACRNIEPYVGNRYVLVSYELVRYVTCRCTVLQAQVLISFRTFGRHVASVLFHPVACNLLHELQY